MLRGERNEKLFKITLIICCVLTLLSFDKKVEAAEYPSKPINFIAPLEAGSSGEILARLLVQKASAFLGNPIIVLNKPGAGSSIGYREIYAAKPDGYTIGMSTVTIVTNKLQA